MKVLSLKQPYALLIKNNIKTIETRSFKTNYRGELYIHASKSKITKDILANDNLISLVNLDDCLYGYIICKCKLVDCIYMDEEFINEIKKNPKLYITGDYQVGRYAWILEDIIPLDNPIETSGKLGIWTYSGN